MGGVEGKREPAWKAPQTAFLLCSDKVKFSLVERYEVGGQPIFVRDSFQINVRCDRKKVIAEIRSEEVLSRFWEKFAAFLEGCTC